MIKCPHCQAELSTSKRQNVEVDYCPKCRGVWLDRGELDQIVTREAKYHGVRTNGYDGDELVAIEGNTPPGRKRFWEEYLG